MMHHGRSGSTHVPATIRSIIYLYLYLCLNLPPAEGFRVGASNPRVIGIAARPRLHCERSQNSVLSTQNSELTGDRVAGHASTDVRVMRRTCHDDARRAPRKGPRDSGGREGASGCLCGREGLLGGHGSVACDAGRERA